MPKMLTIFVLTMIFLLVCSVALHAATAAPKPLDLDDVVEAIRQVEHWDGSSIGASGERGPFQFTKSTWSEFSKKPFWWASGYGWACREEQYATALRYVTWINDNLVHVPLRETAYSVALVYTCGYTAVKHGKPSREKRDYAQRVQTIYDQLTKN